MNLVAGIDAGLFAGLKLLDGDNTVFPGYGPGGVATLLGLQVGFKVTYSWNTPIVDHRDGTEQRISNLDRPAQRYDGQVVLIGTGPRLTRARLARYAAQGSTFLLGLPHEALTLLDDATGAVLTVSPTYLALCDWVQIGQRVVVARADGSASINAVIQSADGGTIVLDVAPGAAGIEGALVMPAMAVLLEPQQDFARYKTAAEAWSLQARAAIFDYAPPSASVDLATESGDAALAGAKVIARTPGVAGNLISFEFDTFTSNPAGGVLAETLPTNTTVQMKGDTDTLGDLAALLDTSSLVKLAGTYNAAAVIGSSDHFEAELSGGDGAGLFGTGATLTMYDGHPVWDRRIDNPQTNTDSAMARTEILDLGPGVPYAISNADYPAWGRTLNLTSDTRQDWQWLKLMLATLRGSQRVFWLATWAADLTWISTGASVDGTTPITISTDDDIGAWYPAQRDRLQIEQDDGTVTYCQITNATDNGDGTTTIIVDVEVSSSTVTMLSWLEPARLEQDDVEVTFVGGGLFSLSIKATAHAVTDPDLLEVEA